jgi:hypothetical protein
LRLFGKRVESTRPKSLQQNSKKKKPIKFYLVFAKLKVSAKEESKKKKAFIPGAGDSVELDRNVGPNSKIEIHIQIQGRD